MNLNSRYNQMRKTLEAKKKKIEEKKDKNKLANKSCINNDKNKIELYKLKMFMDVKSKVAESIKMFKSYRPKRKIKVEVKNNNLSQIDNMINKLEEEAKVKNEESKQKSETLPAIN
jgi:hypothetical protein